MSVIYKQNIDLVIHQNAKDWYNESLPKVSIVILNFNQAHLTIECLKSLWECTQGYQYEIIVVDNGSLVDDFNQLVAFKGAYQLLRLEINRFFGEGNNIGAELAKGEFLLFMGNNVTVTPGWLQPLVTGFQIYPDSGAFGPKFIFSDGKLHEAGGLLDEEGGLVQIGMYQEQNDPRFNKNRAVDCISAATILIRKSIFADVLGFDFIYEPAHYAGIDLCLKIGQLGLKIYYIAESCVIHANNAMTGDSQLGLNLYEIDTSNHKKFITKWANFLTTGRHKYINKKGSATGSFTKNIDYKERKTAAIYTPYEINPGGGERYLLSVAEHLISAGYQTWLIVPEVYSALRLAKISSILETNLPGLGIITTKLAEEMPLFDVFVAMGNEIAPPVKALGQKNLYLCQFPFHCSVEEIERRHKFMLLYDMIVVYSHFSKAAVLTQLSEHALPNLNIHVVSPPVNMLAFDATKSKKSIISVGRFFAGGHCKQHDMLIRAFRRLYEFGINAELHLVGSSTPGVDNMEYLSRCQHLAQGLPVYFHVDAAADTLVSLYKEAYVYWHGCGFGVDINEFPEKCEHFGISIVEAMSAGAIPIVVNNGGPAAIVQHGVNGYHYSSEDELIEYTLEALFEEDGKLSNMRWLAHKRAEDFSKDIFADAWKNLLDGNSVSSSNLVTTCPVINTNTVTAYPVSSSHGELASPRDPEKLNMITQFIKNLDPADCAAGQRHGREQLSNTLWFYIGDTLDWLNTYSHLTGVGKVSSELFLAAKKVLPNTEFLKIVPCLLDEKGVNLLSKSYAEIADFLTEKLGDLRFEHIASLDNDEPMPKSPNAGDHILFTGLVWSATIRTLMRRLAEKNIMFSVLLYDIIPIESRNIVGYSYYNMFLLWLKTIIALAQNIFVSSESIKEKVIKWAEFSRVTIIAKIVVVNFGTNRISNTPAIDELLSNEKVAQVNFPSYVLSVGTIDRRKNQELLVRAWTRLVNDVEIKVVPQLVLVGRDNDLDIKNLNKDVALLVQNNQIVVLENLTDIELAGLYCNCLFTIFPSTSEGYGLPVAESLSYGKLCISTNLECIREHAGDFPWYFESGDIDSAYQLICEAINNKESRLKTENRIKLDYRTNSWNSTFENMVKAIG